MTGRASLGGVALPRPAAAPDPGPLDDAFYDRVESRFARAVTEDPVFATYLGIHAWDDRLGDPSRDQVLHEIAADKRHLAEIEALDPAGLPARPAGRGATGIDPAAARRVAAPRVARP